MPAPATTGAGIFVLDPLPLTKRYLARGGQPPARDWLISNHRLIY
jgi:hypothetical protein